MAWAASNLLSIRLLRCLNSAIARQANAAAGQQAPTSRSVPMSFDLFKAALLGIVEGLTEFIPVSSTGHLLLMEHFFDFDDDAFGKSFAVLIQLGAILALLTIYFGRLWSVFIALPSDPKARRFVLG